MVPKKNWTDEFDYLNPFSKDDALGDQDAIDYVEGCLKDTRPLL